MKQFVANDEGEDTEWNVDEEQPAPVERINENSSERWPESSSESADSSPDADGNGALFSGEFGKNKGERCWREHGATDRLHEPGRHQQDGGWCKTAQDGTDAEECEPAKE